jgi:hypothetical protein
VLPYARRGIGEEYLAEFAYYPILTRCCVGHVVTLIRIDIKRMREYWHGSFAHNWPLGALYRVLEARSVECLLDVCTIYNVDSRGL